MTEQTGFAVTGVWIYPTKDEPGISLPAAQLESDGLAGDRRKKSALLVVCSADARELEPRANLVLDSTADQLNSLIGQQLVVGTAHIEITRKPTNCPGVYASVLQPGTISVGDRMKSQGR